MGNVPQDPDRGRGARVSASLGRRALAEAVGSAALVAVVFGSGIQAIELRSGIVNCCFA